MPSAFVSSFRKSFGLITFAIVLFVPAKAITQSPKAITQGQNAPPSLAINLTRAQFLATMDADYRSMDTNGDGLATRAEVEAYQRRVLTVAASHRARAAFAKLDADRNGLIDLAEYIRANVSLPRSLDVSGPMSKLDANKDGKITLLEYRVLTLSNFDRLDVDKDSIITEVERSVVGSR